MSLAAGSRLGPYEVIAPIGAGGMGEVWKARDPRLGREVAIKVLPEEFFEDEDRVARFEREAKSLAVLNHSGIASVHSFEEISGRHILVMELVEGEGLDARLTRGPIPVEEALPIARQVAEALEAAHAKNLVHRDLKPANIMISDDGKVKLLDFGLAKAFEPDAASGSSPQMTRSPTLTGRATQAGVILGTAAYMSPEQARGKSVDKRADIWAFGGILWEMLTGRRLFEGDTISDILAAVLRQEIAFAALPPETPSGVVRLLHRCLERDLKSRLHDVGDARLEIEDALRTPATAEPQPLPPAAPGRASRLVLVPWLVAAAMTLVALFAIRRGPRDVEDVVRFSVDTPDGVRLDPDLQGQAQLLAMSPDGRRIAFRANDGKERRIFVRDLSRESAQPVSGTEGGTEPFFSPDGEWLGFVAEGKVKKTALRGGTPTTVASANLSRGASWGMDGTIVVAPSVNSPLFRVPAAGGELRPLTTLDAKARERTHRWPEILPDGDTVLFTVGTEDKPGDYDDSNIEAVSLKTGKRHVVYRGASFAKYAPPGHLLLARHGDVLAVPFDAGSAQVRGTVAPVLQGVSGDARSGVCYFGVARTGTVAYAVSLSPQGINEIVWMDRAGRTERTAIPPGNFSEIALSPDGQKLAFAEGPGGGGRSDIWIADLARGGQFQLTSTGRAASPRWAPDGKSVVFATPGGDSILRQPADGSSAAEVLWKSTISVPISVNSLAPDGSAILFSLSGLPSRADIFLLPLSGQRTVRPLISTPYAETHGSISPDGRWLAYMGEYEAGQQVYVQAFPSLAGRWQISRSGGSAPRWARDGKELFFVSGDELFAVPVQLSPTFLPGTPRRLFRIERPGSSEWGDIYDVAPDGNRFVVLLRQEESKRKPRLDVILNFRKTLAERTP